MRLNPKEQFPDTHDYVRHSKFALANPVEYIEHVEKALRKGKGPQEGNYFEDIYTRTHRYLREKEGRSGESI